MKSIIVIPTYWSREKPGKEDMVYDHPTPLNQNGTLGRLLKSLDVIEESDFSVIIISCPTSPSIGEEVKDKVDSIIEPFRNKHKILHFSYPDLLKLHKFLEEINKPEYIPHLSLEGYSNIRNMCIILPHISGADVSILIDDDEVFEDPAFVEKAQEFIGKDEIYAVAGYYIQPHGGYKFKDKREWWKIWWNNTGAMNKAFEIIDTPPRLKDTPFVFGGNMIIHRKMFTRVLFDPYISRGEDIDFLCNAKSKGLKFLLDNKLSVKHLPPPGQNPLWLKMREDIKRFIYMRIKLKKSGYPIKNTMPYPGYFLTAGLYFKIVITNLILYYSAFFCGKIKEALRFSENILLIFKFRKTALSNYPKFKEKENKWQVFMEWIAKNRDDIEEIIG
jgi:glycosyltransferase involved in cell wall biosynthesis